MIGYKVVAAAAACAAVVSASPTFGLGGLGRCGLGLFWWGPKGSCLPNGGLTQWYNPPSYRNCGERWYWHNTLGYCVPPHPGYPDAGCWSGWGWDADSYSCVPVKGHYKE
ncbi:hypothetical protein RhiJN_20642 [Ceratobasidium sp. AG-Ba]|nr:hypothetical protein RhiJN_20642 [Ceratobasidium sp. AG-Ba]